MKLLPKASLFSVYFVYFLTYFGIAVIFPIFTPLILSPKHHFVPHDFDLSLRLLILAMLIATFPFAQFFGAPLFGEMADLKGRKKAFYFSLLGEAAGFLLTGIALKLENFTFLLFSRFFTGFFAGNLTICLAAIADRSTDPQKRMKNFGYLAVVGGLSFILAVFIGGEFSDQELNIYFDPAFPFWILTLMTLCALALIYLYYEEINSHGGKKVIHAWGFKKESFYIFKIPALRFLYIIYFFFMLGWQGVLTKIS